MADYRANYFHSIITDPPYGIGFMGRAWDHGVPGAPYWAEALRVAKPGAPLVAFSSPRTQHRLAIAIENAGWEIVDGLLWLYGNGFPKGLDVAKAIDKRRDDREQVLRVTALVARARDAAGLTNRDIDEHFGTNGMAGHWTSSKSQPAVPQLETWAKLKEFLKGYLLADVAHALDDADELVRELNDRKGEFGDAWHAREVTGDVEEWDGRRAYAMTSADGKRRDVAHSLEAQRWEGWNTALKPAWEPIIVARKPITGTVAATILEHGTGAFNIDACRLAGGRWPSNVLVDADAAQLVDAQTGDRRGGSAVADHPSAPTTGRTYGDFSRRARTDGYYDTGGGSRFFYSAKASSDERDAGVENLFWSTAAGHAEEVTAATWERLEPSERARGNFHPTVKPLAVMRWLARLTTPPGGSILDPFCGSGSTVVAGVLEGFNAEGIDSDPASAKVAATRASHWQSRGAPPTSAPIDVQKTLFD
jgi:hypothetical protein